MFAIHAPQTVELTTDQEGEDLPGMINFSYAGSDTSRCKMQIISKGRTWTFIFNQRGYLVEQSFDNGDNSDPEAVVLTDTDYIVDGHDIRSDNPYTHVPPGSVDSAYLPAAAGPRFAPSKADRELRATAMKDAAGVAEKAREERAARAAETPEQRVAREKDEREAKLKKVNEQMLRSPAVNTMPKVVGEPVRNADGSVVTSDQDRPDQRDSPTGRGYDPLVPAPSSPLPNSPQPTRQSAPGHGVVNTTQSMNQGQAANAQANRDSKGRTPDHPDYDPFK